MQIYKHDNFFKIKHKFCISDKFVNGSSHDCDTFYVNDEDIKDKTL